MNSDFENFLELVKKRRSCRDYSEAPVPDDLLANCIEAARLAPSACNKQPWRFMIVKDCELRKSLCAEGLLPGLPMPWIRNAPVIVVLCSETSVFTHVIAPLISKVQYHLIDIGIAGEHFVLAAEAQGLGTCWIG
ncbi:MAG: nitroreductase family protein, partial [Lentisphaerota bacterium]